MKRYAYGWITALFFLVSIGLHWLFGWWAYVDEAQTHGQAPELASFAVEMGRDTFEDGGGKGCRPADPRDRSSLSARRRPCQAAWP